MDNKLVLVTNPGRSSRKYALCHITKSKDESYVGQIIELAEGENERGKLAFDMFVYRVQTTIGQMVAAMGGVDAIVFTATIGERSAPVRKAVCKKIGYLGCEMDLEKNESATGSKGPENIATEDSKPIWVLHTDESAEILRRAKLLLATIEN